MLNKPFLCLFFVTSTAFAFSITDTKSYANDKVTASSSIASEPQTVGVFEPQQQSSELLQVASEPHTPIIMEQEKPKEEQILQKNEKQGMTEPIMQKPEKIGYETQETQQVKSQEQEKRVIPKKLIVMPIPENPTWMKPNNQDNNRILLDKRDVRYYPIQKK